MQHASLTLLFEVAQRQVMAGATGLVSEASQECPNMRCFYKQELSPPNDEE